MEVVINGSTAAGDFSTVTELLKAEGLDPKLAVIELNGKILPKSEWDTYKLREGDTLEVVQFVAGG